MMKVHSARRRSLQKRLSMYTLNQLPWNSNWTTWTCVTRCLPEPKRCRGPRAAPIFARRLFLQGPLLCRSTRVAFHSAGLNPHLLARGRCKSAGYHRGLARFVREKCIRNALPDLKQATAIAPQFAMGRLQLGTSLFRAQQYRESLEELKHACALAPKLPDTFNYLGEVFAAQGRLEEAGKAFEAAIAVDEGYALAYVNQALLLWYVSPKIPTLFSLNFRYLTETCYLYL